MSRDKRARFLRTRRPLMRDNFLVVNINLDYLININARINHRLRLWNGPGKPSNRQPLAQSGASSRSLTGQ